MSVADDMMRDRFGLPPRDVDNERDEWEADEAAQYALDEARGEEA